MFYINLRSQITLADHFFNLKNFKSFFFFFLGSFWALGDGVPGAEAGLEGGLEAGLETGLEVDLEVDLVADLEALVDVVDVAADVDVDDVCSRRSWSFLRLVVNW